jgi:hypothetical protein
MVPPRAFTDGRMTELPLKVLGYLCGRRNVRTGRCDPKRETIAEAMGITDLSLVTRTINKLVAWGYIRKRAQQKKNGASTSNQYDIIFFQGEGDQGVTLEGDRVVHPDGDAVVTPEGDPEVTQTDNLTNQLTDASFGSDARAHEAQQFDRAKQQQGKQGRLLMPIDGGRNPSQRSNANGRSERIPRDWAPSRADRQYAADRGHDERWIDDQAELFCDHYQANGKPRADWSATWRKWVQQPYAQFADSAGAARRARAGNNGVAAAVGELMSDWDMESG